MSTIYIYAELLLNIRQVTVFVELPSKCNSKTRVELDLDQRTLRLKHEDEESVIELPCSVADNANLRLPSGTARELSFRLVVSDPAIFPAQSKQATDHNDPWPASRLGPETQIACGSCGTFLVTNVNVWKHLPSAGWADLMDFWHCHKPSPINGNDDRASNSKGYAAADILVPTTGTGLVNVTYLLVSSMDCTGIQTADNIRFLHCLSCRENVGMKEEEKESSLRLFKWSLALRRSRELDWETCSVQKIVSAQLLALIEEQAIYKVLAYTADADQSKTALMLWVFTPNLMYSTSAKPTQRAMKVFYSTVGDPSKILEKQSHEIEELQLPTRALQTLKADLSTSTKILPQSARTHRGWTIGLLDRWDPDS